MANILVPLRPALAVFKDVDFPKHRIENGASGGFSVELLEFTDGVTQRAYWLFRNSQLASATVSTLKVSFDWYAENATSGNVVWEAALAAYTPETDSADFLTITTWDKTQTVTDGHLGTTSKRVMRATTAEMATFSGILAGDLTIVRLSRLGADASDTMSNAAMLVFAQMTYAPVLVE